LSLESKHTASVPDFLIRALGERYALEREIGRGGMATIYLARDLQGDRPVALKVMHPNLVQSIGTDRFLREIEIARSLSHPRIVPLYDSGQLGGVLYYAMQYVQGESLFERLAREQRLTVSDAVRVAVDAAEALGYAHQHGVLHRDVKPENILLEGGRGFVADFGLARAIGAANYRRLTETGVIVGTIFYMSPEQLREDPNLDQRTDIYSLGCILYEMLTGVPPFPGTSISQLVTRILKSPVPSARSDRAEVPETVDRAIARALAKSPASRFATAEEFAAAIRPSA
jgi:serine/threonine-protein kinase